MLHPPFALVLSHDVTPCWQDIHHWHSTAQLSWETRVVEERHASHSYFTASISINTSTNTYGRTRHQNPKFTIFQIWGIHPKIWGPPHPPPLHFDVWRTTQSSLSSLQSMLKVCFDYFFLWLLQGDTKGLTTGYNVHVGPKWQHYYSPTRSHPETDQSSPRPPTKFL